MRHKNQMIDTSSDNELKRLRYSAAYPTGAERYEIGSQDFTGGLTPSYLSGKSRS